MKRLLSSGNRQINKMDKEEPAGRTIRDFDTISPSAKALLLMKGYTSIPFARKTAELMMQPEKYIPDFENKDFTFWARTLHFENRYWSIDNLLNDLSIKNILELSSGFSFRGLDVSERKEVYYIDTDLPQVIETKKTFIPALQTGQQVAPGILELLPLNALDEKEFRTIVGHFPPGEIVIVNEGLLMYLSTAEKEQLCRIIHAVLSERGGCWITADIYAKSQPANVNLKVDENVRAFFGQHKIEENKFDSFEAAETFFRRMGFEIEKEAEADRSKLSALNHFLNSVSKEEMGMFQNAPKMQKTWGLKPVSEK